MIRHYLKIAFRNMSGQKMYAAINIGGFAIGIAACLLIALYIKHELSYDKQNSVGDRVYRIVGKAEINGVKHSGISFPAPMSKALVNDFPEIEKAGRIMPSKLFGGAGSNQIRRADMPDDSYEDGFCFADQSVLDILNIPIIKGDKEHALTEPYSMVISKSMADKYFPNEDPIGKIMYFNDGTKMPIKVGGVMKDFPSTAHLQYKFFLSLAGIAFWDGEQETWMASNYGIYLLLRPGVNIAQFDKKITDDVLNKYMIPAREAAGRKDAIERLSSGHLYLQPLEDIHLKSYDIEEDVAKKGDVRFVWMFGAVACFILILACINFLNLSTARSANRAKEVGLRKVIGSQRIGLIKQFLTESLLYSFFSFSIGLLIAYLLLPLFNKMSGTQLTIPWLQWWLLPVLFLSAIIIGLIAGIYPAFYLSAFKPINVLKGQLSRGSKHAGLRGALVVFQFTTSLILLIGTLVIYRQMQFILNKKIGFDKDQVVMIQGTNTLGNQTASFKSELLKLPEVKNVSVSDFLPVAGSKRNGNTFWKEGKVNEEGGVSAQNWVVDDSYIQTLGMKIIAGRNFSKIMPTDSQAVIINKAMADKIGYANPLGKKITNGNNYTIIGIVENFNFESMKQQIDPLCMFLGNSNSVISVNVHGADMKKALASITNVWKSFLPNQAIRYDFLDESYAAMYADVQRMGLIFTSFAVLAIVIACLGLFALTAFMAQQRSKEISIRKVLGASVSNVFALLTGNFLKLVFISLLIAIPVGWWVMQKWLQDYTYRISITWDVFAISGVLVLMIALITIRWQAIKAAVANPVKSLRSE
jgi:putative ABC transport system permease protein